MLLGEHLHTLDSKKRLSLPSKFRKLLGKKVIITKGLDGCLFVYSEGEWDNFVKELSELSLGKSDGRAFMRFIMGGAFETGVDSSGRILIPDYLKVFAKLGTKVVVAGMHKKVELWDEVAWSKYTKKVESQADLLAEKLGGVGML